MSAPKTVLDMGFLVWYTCVNKKEGAVALGMMKIRRNHFFSIYDNTIFYNRILYVYNAIQYHHDSYRGSTNTH